HSSGARSVCGGGRRRVPPITSCPNREGQCGAFCTPGCRPLFSRTAGSNFPCPPPFLGRCFPFMVVFPPPGYQIGPGISFAGNHPTHEHGEIREALALARRAEQYIPNDSILSSLMPKISSIPSIRTTPEGAKVHMKDYSSSSKNWKYVGQSPIEHQNF